MSHIVAARPPSRVPRRLGVARARHGTALTRNTAGATLPGGTMTELSALDAVRATAHPIHDVGTAVGLEPLEAILTNEGELPGGTGGSARRYWTVTLAHMPCL